MIRAVAETIVPVPQEAGLRRCNGPPGDTMAVLTWLATPGRPCSSPIVRIRDAAHAEPAQALQTALYSAKAVLGGPQRRRWPPYLPSPASVSQTELLDG